MNIIEQRLEQSRRELDAYNRIQNPQLYISSGQMDRDRERGLINELDIQSVIDSVHKQKKKRKNVIR